MSYTGHRDKMMPDGRNIVEWVKESLKRECQYYGIPMPSDEQIAVVIRELRMHHLMVHAAGYDFSELSKPDTPTTFYPVPSSIGRFLRDAPLVLLDEIDIGERRGVES